MASWRSLTSICDSRRERDLRGASASMTLAARSARASSRAAPPELGARTSPSMIGRSNCAYRGPNSPMIVPCRSIRYSCVPRRDSPIGRRSRMNTSTVDGSTRLSATSATHGDFNSRRRKASRSAVRMLVPLSPAARARPLSTTAVVAVHDDVANLERRRAHHEIERAVHRVNDENDRNDDADGAPGDPAFLALGAATPSGSTGENSSPGGALTLMPGLRRGRRRREARSECDRRSSRSTPLQA